MKFIHRGGGTAPSPDCTLDPTLGNVCDKTKLTLDLLPYYNDRLLFCILAPYPNPKPYLFLSLNPNPNYRLAGHVHMAGSVYRHFILHTVLNIWPLSLRMVQASSLYLGYISICLSPH